MRLLATIFLSLFCAGLAYGAEIDLLSPAYNWRSPNKDTKIIWNDGKLTITSTRSAGGLYNAAPLDDQKYRLLIIKIKGSRGGLGEVSWTTGQERFSFFKNHSFYLRDGLHYIVVGREKESLDHLLLFTGSGPGTTEISELRLVEGTPFELGLAGWQEFWGPVGREPDGINWLVIRSPRLFGQPFVFYLNALLALGLLYALLTGRRRRFLFLLLAAWLVLEASSLVSNWIALERNAKYFGQPLEQKHIMINTPGFYRFLLAAEKQLPPGASFQFKTPVIYDDCRANYYLYPRLATTETTNRLEFKGQQWN
jgi:hypothetical protein